VGVSPKQFLQCLTIEHAKRLLLDSKTLLEATIDSGLSSPGRLHDLFIRIEGVTPAEFKSRGAGITIQYGVHASPFGWCVLGLSERGICWLSFGDKKQTDNMFQEMRSHWRAATFVESAGSTGEVAQLIFPQLNSSNDTAQSNGRDALDKLRANGAAKSAHLNLLVMGTKFQLKVWQALLRIPQGKLTFYEAIGQSLHCPHSSRAIGSAVAQNVIAYLIPCHRVIRKSGALGEYRWSPARKQAILAWETGVELEDRR
jgi:AraC family transcriptional regulator of adaptative response/methylated-DNA-[protein]-cysteine methyltransferase